MTFSLASFEFKWGHNNPDICGSHLTFHTNMFGLCKVARCLLNKSVGSKPEELLVCLSGYTTKWGWHSWRRPNFDCKRFYTQAVAISAFKASWNDDHSVLRRWGNKLGYQRAWMNQWLTSELWQRRRSKPDELKKGALVLQCLLRVLGFLLVKRHQSSGFRWDGVTMLTTLSFHKKQWETGWWKSSLPQDSLCSSLRFRVRHRCWVKESLVHRDLQCIQVQQLFSRLCCCAFLISPCSL